MKLYYNTMAQTPHNLHRFYSNDSIMTRGEGSQVPARRRHGRAMQQEQRADCPRHARRIPK